MVELSKITKQVEEYRQKFSQYEAFAYAIKAILETLLSAQGYKYQVVFARAKHPDSLKKKLVNQSQKALEDLDDLAGCRILFYLEESIHPFSHALSEEFQIVDQKARQSIDGYNAVHIIVKLNDARLALPEYSRFRGMKCEIQLTTPLYQAWADLAHDIIYKPPEGISEFDEPTFNALNARFKDVMENHIKKATHAFSYIFSQFQKIQEGKKIFDPQFLQSIASSTSNNDLYENLQLLLKFVREFGDKGPDQFDTTDVIRKVLEQAKNNKVQPITTSIGTLEGYTETNIAELCAEILEVVRYQRIEKTFPLLADLANHENPEVAKKALQALDHLSEYNLSVLRKYGYLAQLIILEQIEKWNDIILISRAKAIIQVMQSTLETEFEGQSLTQENALTIEFGPLTITDKLKNIRKRAMLTLQRLYVKTENIEIKKMVIEALIHGTYLSFRSKYGDDMTAMVNEDIDLITRFYIEVSPDGDNDVLRKIEEQVISIEQRFPSKKDGDLKTIHSLLTQNKEYQIFRILVGYDRHFDRSLGWEAAGKMRAKEIDRFIRSISTNKFTQWIERILSLVQRMAISSAPEEYYNFRIFLNRLGKRKPLFAGKLIEQHHKKIQLVLPDLMAGFWDSTRQQDAKKLVQKWINNGEYLSQIASMFQITKKVNLPIVHNVIQKAKKVKNGVALFEALTTIGRRTENIKDARSIFMELLEALRPYKKYWWWPVPVFYWKIPFLKDLDEKEVGIILDSFYDAPAINHDIDSVLAIITERYPQKVIDFLKKRVIRKNKRKNQRQYDAIPFNLAELGTMLRSQATIVIPAILQWYGEKNALLQWEGSHLLGRVFPSLGDELEKVLLTFIKKGGEKNARIILSVLNAYEGQPFLHTVCKEFIKQYGDNKKYRDTLFGIMRQTGVVSGEDGFIKAYEVKKQQIQEWKSDENKAVKDFALNFERYLDEAIAQEKRSIDRGQDMRQLEAGS